MINKEQQKMIDVSRKYGLLPGTLKCRAFALFEEGYSKREVTYLLGSFRGSQSQATFTRTIRRYHDLWRQKGRTLKE